MMCPACERADSTCTCGGRFVWQPPPPSTEERLRARHAALRLVLQRIADGDVMVPDHAARMAIAMDDKEAV